jgi:antibiotic biosynthesis monooxygenase (ABM) superfamily enzyme
MVTPPVVREDCGLIIRQGFFEGRIRPGMDEKFFAYVRDEMVPVWRSFPGLIELRVSTATASEDGIEYPLHTSFSYPTQASLDAVLTSPERQEALKRTKVLLEMFEGRVFHVVTRPLVHGGREIGR